MRLSDNMRDIMDRVIVIMHREDTLMVPVKRLCRITQSFFPEPIHVETFKNLLLQDHRFLVIETDLKHGERHHHLTEDELEAIGYDHGPRVMIRSRMPERQEMLDMLVDKADKTFESLKHAWDIRSADDVETEDRLLNALAKAQRLQRELKWLTHELEKTQEPIEYT